MKVFHFILIGIVFSACVENSADFFEPQPAGAKDLQSFPVFLQGKYQNYFNNNALLITPGLLIKSGEWDVNLSKQEVDSSSNLKLVNDTLIDLEENRRIPVTQRNDSVFGKLPWEDTVFAISPSCPLRKLKDFYLVNNYTKNSLWKVARLKVIRKSSLEIALINREKEAIELKKYTTLYELEMKSDTIVNYKLKPTRSEFKRMLEAKLLFTDKEIYRKIE